MARRVWGCLLFTVVLLCKVSGDDDEPKGGGKSQSTNNPVSK